MAGTSRFPPTPHHGAVLRRLIPALAVSTLLHGYLAAVFVASGPQPGPRPAEPEPITVRIATASIPAVAAPEQLAAAQRVGQPVPGRGGQALTGAARTGTILPQSAPPPRLRPQLPESAYYAARDLDVYPRPASPLELDRIAAGVPEAAARRVRLALLIDEFGAVNKITVVESGAPGRLGEDVRAVLAATRFLPAQKDGRAVRSRIEVSINLAAAGER